MKTKMKDIRCREEFANWCKNNPTNRYCVPFELNRAKKYCEVHSESILCKRIGDKIVNFCKNHPDNPGCAVVKQTVINNPRLLERAQAIRNRIREINTGSMETNTTVGGISNVLGGRR